MKQLNIYINEKLKIDKDISISKSYTIIYKSVVLTKESDVIKTYESFLDEHMKHVKVHFLKQDREGWHYKITADNQEAFLYILMVTYYRGTNNRKVTEVIDDFDKVLNFRTDNYSEIKDNIHKLYSDEDIISAWRYLFG